MKKFHIPSVLSICLCFLFCMTGHAHTGDPFNLPAGIPVPAWVSLTDWTHPNIHAVDSLIKVSSHSSNAHGQAGQTNEFEENPYLTAYIRWRNKMAPFVQPDGTVVYDRAAARQKQFDPATSRRTGNAGHQVSGLRSAVAQWKLLGPVQTFSDNNNGLATEQSNIYCIAVAPSNPSVVYASSEPGTLYRSSDKGQHWSSVTDTLYSCQASTIAIDPHNENIVYCYDGNTNVILKTTDGGASWIGLSADPGGGDRMVISPATGRILITGDTVVYYSDDAGATWHISAGSGTMTDIALDPANPDTVYASGILNGNFQLIRSVDAGLHFTDVTGSLTGLSSGGSRLGVTMANSSYVYCINIGGSSAPRIIRSTDRGRTWTVTVTSTDSTSLTGTDCTSGFGMSNGQGYYDLDIVVDPLDANSVIVGTTSTYRSTDGGFNFASLGGYHGNFGLHPDLQQAVANGSDAYLVTDGGVNYSTDFFANQSNWSVRNHNLRSGDFWGFGQGWDQDIVVGGRYHNGDMALYENYGAGNSLRLGGGEDATGHVFHGQSAIAGFRDIGTLQLPSSLSGSIRYSGAFTSNTLWPQDDYYGLFSSKLVVDPRYSNVFYVGNDSALWKSTNGGASYTALHSFGAANKVWRFDISRSNNNVIYLCATSGIFKTTDGGNTWTQLNNPASYQYYNTDIAVNPLNENNVIFCMSNGSSTDKVFESGDGGSTWTNITGTMLVDQYVSFLQYQGGANGGKYAITNGRPSYVYYRDSTMSDWIAYSSGLPTSLEAREGALIFYRDSKIRLGGNCSIFESPLYTTGSPVAQPMADKQQISCSSDTVNFFDYSMYDYTGAKRLWTFPGASWVSSDTALRPRVLYPGPGSYSVTLQITDAQGRSHTRTIDSIITFDRSLCGPDTVAGLCVQMPGDGSTINLGNVPINSNSFSISAWVQPHGLQSSFSQIVSHDAYPGSGGYGFAMGFTFSGYTPNLQLCYTDSIVNYGSYSGLICDSSQWNYVVLTYAPDGVTMYLNGIASKVNTDSMPVIDLSQTPFYLNFDAQEGQGSNFNGDIDEVKFYNYALSQEEVRQKMHLIQNPASAETGLIKYFQFNQYDINTSLLHDAFGSSATDVPATYIVPSTAPVSTGTVYSNHNVSGAGLNSFPAANVKMYLPAGGTYPDSEVVAFHLWSNPDTKPAGTSIVPGYFVINNYGTNTSFSQPDSIVFGDLMIDSAAFPLGNFKLFKRSYGAFGATWGNALDSSSHFGYATAGSSVSYGANNGITSLFSQLAIMSTDTLIHPPADTTAGVTSLSAGKWQISELYPNPASEWSKINIIAPDASAFDAILTITDIRGTQLMKMSQPLNKTDNTIMLHIPRWSEGVYFLTVDVPGHISAVRKFEIE